MGDGGGCLPVEKVEVCTQSRGCLDLKGPGRKVLVLLSPMFIGHPLSSGPCMYRVDSDKEAVAGTPACCRGGPRLRGWLSGLPGAGSAGAAGCARRDWAGLVPVPGVGPAVVAVVSCRSPAQGKQLCQVHPGGPGCVGFLQLVKLPATSSVLSPAGSSGYTVLICL